MVITPPNLGQTPAHNPNIHLDPVLGVFVHHYRVPQADLGAHFTRAIDSIHQGLSNALTTIGLGYLAEVGFQLGTSHIGR